MKQFGKWLLNCLAAICIVCFSFAVVGCGAVNVSLSETTLTLEAGESETLVATVDKEGATVVWSSSDESVLTVENGKITGLKAGEATVTATVEEKYSASCEVTVVNTKEREIDVDTEITLTMTDTYQLVPELKEGSKTIEGISWKYAVDDPPYVSVSTDGLITPTRLGTFPIKVSTTYLGVDYEATVSVTVIDDVEFALDEAVVELVVPEDVDGASNTKEFTYTFTRNGSVEDVTVTWVSSDENVVTVDANGTVKAIGLGSARITATADGYEAFADVKVVRAVIDATATNQLTVNVNEISTWALTVADVTEKIVEITDGETVISTVRDDENVYLQNMYVEGKAAGDTEELYVNTAFKSYKVGVSYVETYTVIDPTSLIMIDGAKEQCTVTFTAETAKTQGRYGVYSYVSKETETGKNGLHWYNRVGVTGLTDLYAANRYLAFDFYLTDTTGFYGLWFYVSTAPAAEAYRMIYPNNKGGTSDEPVAINGSTGVTVINESGNNVVLDKGFWATVIIDLQTIYADDDPAREVGSLYFSIRENDGSTSQLTAYFSNFRVYTEDQFKAADLVKSVLSLPVGIDASALTKLGSDGSTYSIGAVGTYEGKEDAYLYQMTNAKAGNTWGLRIGIADASAYYKDSRYLAFDFYVPDVSNLTGLYFTTAFGPTRYIRPNGLSAGASEGYPATDGTESVLMIDSTGNVANLEAGKWMTLIIDLTTINGSKGSNLLYLSAYLTKLGNCSIYFANFRTYNETQYAEYIGGFTGRTASYKANTSLSTEVAVGSTVQISAALCDALIPVTGTEYTVSYASANEAVATVDAATGVATGVAKGAAKITVTITVGETTYQAVCWLTVSA